METKTKTKSTNKYKKSIGIMFTLFVVFIILNCTPNLALRTYLVMHGHPIIAVTSKIESDAGHIDLETKNTKFLKVVNAPIETQTATFLRNYKVNRTFFIYFVSYYGNG